MEWDQRATAALDAAVQEEKEFTRNGTTASVETSVVVQLPDGSFVDEQGKPIPPVQAQPKENPAAATSGGPGYLDRYLQHVNTYTINVGPAVGALAGGLWPKSLAPITNGRGPLLGSKNPLTSVPRALGIPGAARAGVQYTAATIGVSTVAIGWYNVGVFVSGLVYAIEW